MNDLQERTAKAVRFFWRTRSRQRARQDDAGRRDQGSRSEVTGGTQMDGFVRLVEDLVVACGIPREAVYCKERKELPGFFRPTKEWDLLIVPNGELLATVEFKSQVGPSFGNNFNNRTEEALGSATDLWTAYREGAFRESVRPWLGYFMLLEETARSTSPVAVKEPHFPVFDEFRGASYAVRYEILCRKLMRERFYDAACLLLSDRKGGLRGRFREPSRELALATFVNSLTAKATAYLKNQET